MNNFRQKVKANYNNKKLTGSNHAGAPPTFEGKNVR